jgi:hypothetical protein
MNKVLDGQAFLVLFLDIVEKPIILDDFKRH